MKPHPYLPRIIALILIGGIVLFLSTGCGSSRYQTPREGTPPARVLNAAFAPGPLDASRSSLITHKGPGLWKRGAVGDEYFVALRNPRTEPLVISNPDLLRLAAAP